MKIIITFFLMTFNLTLFAQTVEDCTKYILKKEKEIELKDSTINSYSKQFNRSLDSIKILKGLINNSSAWKNKYDSLEVQFQLKNNTTKIQLQKEDSIKKAYNALLVAVKSEVSENNELLGMKKSLDSLYTLPIDDIVNLINVTVFNRDKKWLNSKPQVKNTLQYIFDGQQCLKEKFNAESVNKCIKNLKSIEQTQIVKGLTKSLTDYNAVNELLKKAIGEVMVMEQDGYDKALGDKVFRKQMPPLLIFIYQQRCTYEEFPYLFNVLVEAINIKGNDQSKSIGGLLSKL
jgi:hypothetical protein